MMTLRNKTLLATGTTLFSLILLLYAAAQIIVGNGFHQLEEADTQANVRRVLAALARELEAFNGTAADWAEWDDTYEFIQSSSQDYVAGNLTNETFVNLRVNFMLFINTQGDIVYQRGFDLVNGQEISVPQGLNDALISAPNLPAILSGQKQLNGLTVLAEQPILVAARPILDSQKHGPARGLLVLARYLDTEQLSETIQLPIAIYAYADLQLPKNFREARTLLSASDPAAIFVLPLNERLVAGYTVLRDINNQPGLIMRIDLFRTHYQQGQTSLSYLVLSLVVAGVTFSVVILLLLEKLVLARVARLSTGVQRIGSQAKERLPVVGRDELANLALVINQTLDHLAEAQERLLTSEVRRRELEKEHEVIELKERFISTVSHEFRTPLTVILSCKEILHRYYERLTSEKRSDRLNEIEKQARYMLSLLDDVLTLSQARASKLEFAPAPLNLVDFCHNLCEQMRLTDNDAHVITFTVEGSFDRVAMDEQLLRHILMNLLSNAIKYSPRDSEIHFTLSTQDQQAVFRISDQGIGISAADQMRLFEPFNRGRNTKGINGTGLGLAIVKHGVEIHGGRLSLESQEGRGTTVTVSLPLDAQPVLA